MAVSMSGLDLSFLKTKTSQDYIEMMKERHKPKRQPKPKRSSLPAPLVMSDIKPFVSPVDRTVISSRSILARHNRANGVRQCGEVSTKEIVDHANRKHAELSKPQEGVSFAWTPYQNK